MPVVIEENTNFERPLNHARICYDNKVIDATVTATSEQTNFEATAVQNPFTYEFWRPNSQTASLTIAFDSSQDIDYIALGSQNLKGEITIKNGSTEVITYDATGENENILFLIKERSFDSLVIEIDSTSYGELAGSLGVVYAGKTLEMYRPFFEGFTPFLRSRTTKILSNKSESGQFLGKSIINQGYRANFEWDNLPSKWYNEHFDAFVEKALQYPFFVAWNPLRYPDDILYCEVNQDIIPTFTGTKDFLRVGFRAEGIK